MKTSSLLLLTGLLAGLFLPSAARAQGDDEESEAGRLRVGVFLLSDKALPNARRAELTRGLERALRRNPKIVIKDKDLLYARFSGEIPTDAVAEARALSKTGRELLEQDRPQDAVLKLAAADAALENVLAFVKKGELADAQFLRGVAAVKIGDKQEARATFARLYVWRPDYVVDVERYPGALPVWEEARRQVKKAGTGSLQIMSEPEGAMAFVDGRYVGTTPVTASGLATGEHYVTLKLEAYKRRLIKAPVEPRVDELVSESLPRSEKYRLILEILAKVKPDAGKDVAGQALVDLGRFLGLEQVVLAQVKREGRGVRVDAHLYDLRSRKRLSSVAGVKLPADEDAASLKLEEVAGSLYLNVRYDGKTDEELRAAAERARKPKEPPKPSGPPFYTKWWFWTIVGGVVVAGATPLVYSAFSEGGPSCPRAHCTELVWEY